MEGESQPELWVGLVEVRRRQRQAGQAPGAFTNIVTWACDASEFRTKAETIATIDMFVVDVEYVEPVRVRAESGVLTEAIEELVGRAKSNPKAILLGTIHNYLRDDA